MSVGLVIVSHSERIAEGVVELASQMAGTTTIVAAGGTDEGGIGTSFDRVIAAIGRADGGDGVVVLCDLGSAILTAETALDFLDDAVRASVLIADAPLVEGAVVAAVAAEGGGTRGEVRDAAESAGGASARAGSGSRVASRAGAGSLPTGDDGVPSEPSSRRTVTVLNADGLHARPAAHLVKLASGFSARVTVNDIDAKSLLGVMSLGLRAGAEVTLVGSGPDADAAVAAMADLIESGFGEPA